MNSRKMNGIRRRLTRRRVRSGSPGKELMNEVVYQYWEDFQGTRSGWGGELTVLL
jgi:hypothetical protein